MTDDCLFCKIINRELEADFVYEDSEIVAFKDIHPAAPVHLLVVPRKHIATYMDLQEDDEVLMGRLHYVVNDLARAFKLDKKGFRVVINCGKAAGQMVYHLHLHLLGGMLLKPDIAKGRGV
jgi:histidine triad (HIT) family protein